MKKRYRLTSALVLGCLTIGSAAFAAGDPDAGRAKARACMGCHAIPGYSNAYPGYRVPKLAGQHPEYLVTALKAYKSGLRTHPTMRAQAADLSDSDMANIAAYFSASSQ